jgi:hypothetical protein
VKRIKNDVGAAAGAEFQQIIAVELVPFDLLTVYEGAVLTPLVNDPVNASFVNNLGMIAGDARIGDDKILIDLSSDGERTVDEGQASLVTALNQDKGRKGA